MTQNPALLRGLGEASINKSALIRMAREWYRSSADLLRPPHWAEDRDKRRWKALLRAQTPAEWQPLLAGFAARRDDDKIIYRDQRVERWLAIVDSLRPSIDNATRVSPREEPGQAFEQLATPELLTWRQEEQQHYFLQCCCQMVQIGNCPDLRQPFAHFTGRESQ